MAAAATCVLHRSRRAAACVLLMLPRCPAFPTAGFSLGALEQLLAENQRLAAVEAQAVGQVAAAAQLRELQVG